MLSNAMITVLFLYCNEVSNKIDDAVQTWQTLLGKRPSSCWADESSDIQVCVFAAPLRMCVESKRAKHVYPIGHVTLCLTHSVWQQHQCC
jgi:hypothetical protein